MSFSFEDYARRREPTYGPVRLVYTDGPMTLKPHSRWPMARVERFENNAQALRRVEELTRDGVLYNACISDEGEHTVFHADELKSRVG